MNTDDDRRLRSRGTREEISAALNRPEPWRYSSSPYKRSARAAQPYRLKKHRRR